SRSPVAVSAIEKSRDVLLDRIPQCGERARISGASQVLDGCVSEVLIAVADLRWHVDILDVGWAPECGEHGADQIAKARWPAGADIVDAVDRGCCKHPIHHVERIVDIDEIAFLLAVGDVRTMRLEQTNRLAAFSVIEGAGHQACHRALMVLVGAEYIE